MAVTLASELETQACAPLRQQRTPIPALEHKGLRRSVRRGFHISPSIYLSEGSPRSEVCDPEREAFRNSQFTIHNS
jgi:hypothetical protein